MAAAAADEETPDSLLVQLGFWKRNKSRQRKTTALTLTLMSGGGSGVDDEADDDGRLWNK